MTGESLQELDRRMLGDTYTSREVWDTFLALCDDCGPRFAGTSEEKKAADFIAGVFERYGLRNVHLESFPINGWQRRVASLEVVEPVSRSIPCISLPYSPPHKIVGELCDVGTGTSQEYEAASARLKDSLVMASNRAPQGRYIHRREKYDRAVLAGSRAFIWVNDYPAVGPETGCLTYPAPIPGISIAFEDAAFLRRLMQRSRGVRLSLTTNDKNEPRTAHNVVADLPGNKSPESIIIIGSHYDSHDIAPGGVDSASGVVAILEAARVLARYAANALNHTLRFITFSGEELGLLGSYAYTNSHDGELDNIRLFLNFDATGSIEGRKSIAFTDWPDLENLVRGFGPGMDISTGKLLFADADSFPFFLKGIPTGSMRSAEKLGPSRGMERGVGHTFYDTVDKVSLSRLQETSAAAAQVALRFAGLDGFPTSRRSNAAVQQLLNADPAFEGYRVAASLK